LEKSTLENSRILFISVNTSLAKAATVDFFQIEERRGQISA